MKRAIFTAALLACASIQIAFGSRLEDEEKSGPNSTLLNKIDKINLVHNYLDNLPAVGKVISF